MIEEQHEAFQWEMQYGGEEVNLMEIDGELWRPVSSQTGLRMMFKGEPFLFRNETDDRPWRMIKHEIGELVDMIEELRAADRKHDDPDVNDLLTRIGALVVIEKRALRDLEIDKRRRSTP